MEFSGTHGRWLSPIRLDSVVGMYPSMVELPDKLVFCVYYEESKGSSNRGLRLRIDTEGVTVGGQKE